LASGGITIDDATYGLNCRFAAVPSGYRNTASPGNVTDTIRRMCGRRETCEIAINAQTLGDAAPFCAKDFSVTYSCPGEQPQTLPPEAAGHKIQLSRGAASTKASD
jgi:hypothetical protein